jgi:hypothetical protein
MKSVLRLAMLSLLLCAPSHAYDVEAGAVLICDTQEQVERFVQLFDGSQELAVDAVNSEESNPNACALVNARYVTGPQLVVARNKSHAFEITPVVIIGMATPNGYRPVKPTLFFSLVSLKEFAI